MQLRFVNRTNMAVCVLVLKNAKCFVVAYKISWAHCFIFTPSGWNCYIVLLKPMLLSHLLGPYG